MPYFNRKYCSTVSNSNLQMHRMLPVFRMVVVSTQTYELYEELTSHLHVEVPVNQLLTISGPILVEHTRGLHYHW